MKHRLLRLVPTAVLSAALLAVGSTLPASAMGSTTWNDCWGGYTGSSMYTSANSTSHASTTRVGGCGYVAAAIRYYGGEGDFRSSNGTYISTSRQAVAYGGWHWSRSNGNRVSS